MVKDDVMESVVHVSGNREIFNSSAVSIFLVYNPETNMPRYNGQGYLYACLDAGIMTGMLGVVAEMNDLSLCSIGEMQPQMNQYIPLPSNHKLIHSIELGYKKESNIKSNVPIIESKEESKPKFKKVERRMYGQ
ncbi:hypothetical protein A3842_07840 [Paenibacillus sp. P3E]|nr:hypothetical protein A3842_07840 [Paenibacillus sp. P3E]